MKILKKKENVGEQRIIRGSGEYRIKDLYDLLSDFNSDIVNHNALSEYVK